MSATIQRTVTWVGNNTTQNPNFEWVNVNNVTWVQRSDSTQANTSDFLIQNNDTTAVRTSQWEVRHWNYVNDNTLVDSFTITQDADGVVTTTTTGAPTYTVTYQAVANPSDIVGTHPSTTSGVPAGNYTVSGPTWTVTGMTFIGYAEGDSAQAPANIQPGDVITITGDKTLYAKYVATTTTSTSTTTTTTNPPVNYSLTLGSGTSGTQAVQFTEANPNSQSISYTQSPNSGTPAVLVDSLPAWLTSQGITDSAIQLSLNPDSSTYPADSVGFNMTYRHGDAPVGQGEDELYVEFIAAPANSILVTSTSATPVSEAPNGEGESTYTDNNSSNSATQPVAYTLSLDPDVTLTSSEVYWSTSLPSTSGHQASPNPYWATVLTIDNTPSSGQAQITYAHVDPNAGSGGSLPGKNAPLTEEQAGTQSSSPGILPANQRYVIATHPDDTSHWVAILVTAPIDSITTTTTIPTYSFEFTAVLPPSLANSGTIIASYTTDVPNSILEDTDQNGIYTHFSVENPASPASSYISSVSGSNGTVSITVNEGNNNTNGAEILTINFNQSINQFLLTGSSVTSIDFTYEPCHVEGTVMNLADGTTKLVEDLQVGDVLASYDIAGLSDAGEWRNYSSQINQFSASSSTATVTGITAGQYTSYHNFNNDLTKVTGEHPILVKTTDNDIQFKHARDVIVGDSFYTASGWVAVTSNELVEETVNTYSIDVETEDVYMADGILFHNTEQMK